MTDIHLSQLGRIIGVSRQYMSVLARSGRLPTWNPETKTVSDSDRPLPATKKRGRPKLSAEVVELRKQAKERMKAWKKESTKQ